MALTRNLLKSIGLNDEQISAVIENHMETVEGLKAERDSNKEAAASLSQAQAEVTRLTGELEQAKKNTGDAARVQADFDAYRQQVEAERSAAMNESDLLAIAQEAGIQRESFRRMAVKTFDAQRIKRGENNTIANRDELLAAMKADYPDFIATEPQPKGPGPLTPPTEGGKTYTREQIQRMSADEINKNWDAVKTSLASAT